MSEEGHDSLACVLICFRLDCIRRGDAVWNVDLTTTTMVFRASELPNRPKPHLTFGVKIERSATSPSSIDETSLRVLEDSPNTNLHPRPSPDSMHRLAYPCLIHEVKHESGSLEIAENQLAESLVFALEQQEELRLLANDVSDNSLPIFGLISIGTEVKLYCAVYQSSKEIVSYSTHFTTGN